MRAFRYTCLYEQLMRGCWRAPKGGPPGPHAFGQVAVHDAIFGVVDGYANPVFPKIFFKKFARPVRSVHVRL